MITLIFYIFFSLKTFEKKKDQNYFNIRAKKEEDLRLNLGSISMVLGLTTMPLLQKHLLQTGTPPKLKKRQQAHSAYSPGSIALFLRLLSNGWQVNYFTNIIIRNDKIKILLTVI